MSDDTGNKFDSKTFRAGDTIFEWDMDRAVPDEDVIIKNETGMVKVPFEDLILFAQEPFKRRLHKELDSCGFPRLLTAYSRGIGR